MAITFNTGTTATSGGSSVGSLGITIPAGVLAGDVIIVVTSSFQSGSGTTLSASSTGTSPTQIGSTTAVAFSGNAVTSALFYVVASATDAGKVITVSNGGSEQMALALAAWTGASNVTPIDVAPAAATAAAASATITCPSATTGVNGDWDIQLVGAALGGSSFAGGTGFTQREAFSDGTSGATVLIYDSNASVGPAGTGIGGANFTNAGHNNWWVGWTVGLAPGAASNPAGTVQPLATVPVARRKPGRAVVNFTPVVTVNTGHGPAGRAQPLAASLVAPRRKPARAVVQFIPVTTTNAPAKPHPAHGTPSSDEARGWKRWLLWGP